MAGNVNRGGGGLVYHWRHGWIPRTPTAALQKAHGSQKGASKLMDKHGIKGDVPGGKGKSGVSKPSVAKAHPAPHTLKPGEHATVHGVDEHGAPIHFTGEVRGTTSVTMSKGGKKTPMLGITVKRESPTTGAMRHDTVYVPDPNRDPAKIDAARKAGGERDQLRRDLNAKYSGKGSSYMQQRHGIDPAAMSDTDLAKYHKSLQAEHDMVLLSDGKKLRDATAAEVAKRNAAPSTPKADASRAKVRDLPADGTFSRSHSETFMGEKITVRKTEQGRHETLINGEPFSAGYGSRNKHAVAELDQARKSIEAMKSSSDPKFRGLYGMKSDKPAASGIEAQRTETQRSQAEHLRAASVAHGNTKPQPSAGDLSDAAAIWKRQNPGKPIAGNEREVSRLAERLAEQKFIRKNQQGDTASQAAAEKDRIRKAAANVGGSRAMLDRLVAEKQGKPAAGEKPKPAKKYVLERTLPDGTVKTHSMPMFPKQASQSAAYVLHDNGVLNKGDSQRGVGKRLETTPVGQHIEAGGYKFRLVEHNPDAAKVEAGRQKVQADAGAAHAARAAELRAAAAKKRADADRIANGAGVNDRAAAMLSGKTHARQVARDDSSLRRFAETRRQADALEAQARTAEGRVAREQEKQRAANLDLKPSDVTPGDMVLHNGRLQIVTKVNKTTVNVPSGYSWDDKVPLSKVTRHVPLSTQSDASIQKAYGATKDPKVKAALRAELLRRGLSAA